MKNSARVEVESRGEARVSYSAATRSEASGCGRFPADVVRLRERLRVLKACARKFGSRGLVNCAADAAACFQSDIRCILDRVDAEMSDVPLPK